MRYLLDTHAFLWWILDDARLSTTARHLIEDGNNDIHLSAASAWEIAIKAQIGKLPLPANPEIFVSEQIIRNGFSPLNISISHALHTHQLSRLHSDPFDRILVAQSLLEKMPILSSDALIKQYPVETRW